MRSYNRTFLIGNCAAEPILSETKKGGTYMYFPIAVERNQKKADNETKEVDFHRIVFWGEISQKLETMIKKGTRLFVTGKIVNFKYESNSESKYITEIHASQIEVLTFDKSSNTEAKKEKELAMA